MIPIQLRRSGPVTSRKLKRKSKNWCVAGSHSFPCESSLVMPIETRVRYATGPAQSLETGGIQPACKTKESQGCGKGGSKKEWSDVCLHPSLFCNMLTPHPSLGDLGNPIKSLREDADSWSGLLCEVQSILPDIKHLRTKADLTIGGQSLAKSSQCARGC